MKTPESDPMSKPSERPMAPAPAAPAARPKAVPPQEVGGRGGLEPTRYGDWEINGRCVDF
jgi:hypothetical protein